MAVIVPLAIVIPFLASIYKWKLLSSALRIFTYYLILCCIGNIISGLFASKHQNNLPALHIYTCIEFLFISLFYKKISSKLPILLIYLLILCFVVFCITDSFFLQNILIHNSYARSLESAIVILYSLLFLKESLDNDSPKHQYNKTLVYINFAFLMYFGGSFFLFLFVNFLTSNQFLNYFVWNLHATLVLIMYILFTIGLLHVKKLR